MSETTKKTTKTEEQVNETTAAKKPAAKKTETKEKENWFKRTGKKIKNGMSNHPFWTAFGGAAVGSAATVGLGYGGKKLMESRRKKKEAAYIPTPGEGNTLDPNI